MFGGIYRIRKKGADRMKDPRGTDLGWATLSPDHLAALLADPRPVVRDRAIELLARLGDPALPALRDRMGREDEKSALGALWALARIRTGASRQLVRVSLENPVANVRQAGAALCGLERDPESLSGLMALLKSGQPLHVQREAATALGRLKNPAACTALLEAGLSEDPATGLQLPADRFLAHAAVHALLEINDPAAVRRHRPKGQRSRWRAWLVLDQLPDGQLKAEEVIDENLDRDSPLMALIQRHPEWEAVVASRVEASVREEGVPLFGLECLHWPAVAGKVSELLLQGAMPDEFLKVLGEWESSEPMADALVPGIEHALLTGVWESAGVLDRLRIQPGQLNAGLEAWLQKVVLESVGEEKSWEAVRVLARCGKPIPEPGFNAFLGRLGSADLENVRLLGEAALTEAQKKRLAMALPGASLVELPLLLEIFKTGGSRELGESLAAGLAESPPARSAVPVRMIEGLAGVFPESVRKNLRSAIPERTSSVEVEQRLTTLLAELPSGDPKRGHQVFKSSKAACATCHRLGYDGGQVGPDLSRIGSIRSRKDLLEAIVAPSASYARGYESTLITTTDGATAMGILSRGKEAVFLTDVLGR
ncbi:MAG: HEAT repeat domain-containing protein, partial [Verrucomicrobiota bacterium]